MFNEEIKNQLKEILKAMKLDVHALYFGGEENQSTEAIKTMLKELSEVTNKFVLEEYDLDSDLAREHNIDKNGGFTLVTSDKKVNGVKFYGPPAGYEINSLIHTILDVSEGHIHELEPEVKDRIEAIDKKVDIKVFIGLQCPHCPGAVITAHTLARLNMNVEAEMVEASSYPELAEEFNISSVPRIIINNGQGDLLGNQPIEEFLRVIESL